MARCPCAVASNIEATLAKSYGTPSRAQLIEQHRTSTSAQRRFWLYAALLLTLAGMAAGALAFAGLPYSPLSSYFTGNPYDRPTGTVVGYTDLQGASSGSLAGTLVMLAVLGSEPVDQTYTQRDGSFAFHEVPPDTYEVTARRQGWLSDYAEVEVFAGGLAHVDLALLAGDVDPDDDVDLDDLRAFQDNLGELDTPEKVRFDINGDGVIDILDMVWSGINFGKVQDLSCAGFFGSSALTDSEMLTVDVTGHPSETEPGGIHPLIFDFDVAVATADGRPSVSVEYQRADGEGDRLVTRRDLRESAPVHDGPAVYEYELPVLRLEPTTQYCYRVVAEYGSDPVAEGELASLSDGVLGETVGSFRTGPLPIELADSTFELVEGAPTSYDITFIDHRVPGFGGLVGLDSQANVVWYHRPPEGAIGTMVQDPETLNLLFEVNPPGGVQLISMVSPLGTTIAQSPDVFCGEPPDPLFRDGAHHEILAPDASGDVYYLGRIVRDPFSNPARLQQADSIRKWNINTGTDVAVWDPFDFLDPVNDRTASSDSAGGRFWAACDGKLLSEDWTHANSLQFAPDGNIIMSIRHLDQIIALAPDLESVAWRLGDAGRLNAPYSDFAFPDPTDQFYHQHSARQLPNGNILLFDNGNGRLEAGDDYSRALELALDFGTMEATKVWEYRHTPDLYAAAVSNVTRLANGNTVVNFGGDFSTPQCCREYHIVEATPGGEARSVIRVTGADAAVQYRAYPVGTIFGEEIIAP